MISPLAHVDPAAKIGQGVTIHPFAFVDRDAVVGDNCEIMPYASICRSTVLGKNVKVYQGAVVGADPQDFRWKGENSICTIGDNCIIREHVIINRGFRETHGTVIGADTIICADSHVGHDCVIDGSCVLGNGVTIAGGVHIEIGSILSSNVVVHEGSRIGKFALIKGGTRISSNVPPYTIMAHNPATYYGVNNVVMERYSKQPFSSEEIDDVAKAYRHIYQTQTSTFNALKRIEADIEPSRVRDEILNFVRGCNLRITGIRVDLAD